MTNKFLKHIFKVPIIFSMVGTFSIFSAESLEKMTSKKNAKKIEKSETKASSSATPAPRISSSVNKHSFGLGIGQTFLSGNFADNGEDKITPDLYYNYSASYSFDMLVNVHSSKHKFRDKWTRLTGANLGIKSKAYQFDAFAPYVVGGFGFYQPKMNREVNGSNQKTETKTIFGYHLGAGGELRLNPHFLIGFIGQYHNPFDVKQDVGEEVEGSYFKLLMTIFYTL